MLTLHNLSAKSTATSLFHLFGVTLLPGCLLQIKGPNGIGKTLLMEMIAGKTLVEKEHISFAHQETRGDSEFFEDLQYIPQGHDFLPKRLTVQKYLQKIAPQEAETLIDAVLQYFDLRYVADQKIGTLTPGWRQRLLLAPLILQPSAIWLLDRPFQSLDTQAKQQLEHLIAGRCQQNGIVLFVHDDDTRLNAHHQVDLGDWAS